MSRLNLGKPSPWQAKILAKVPGRLAAAVPCVLCGGTYGHLYTEEGAAASKAKGYHAVVGAHTLCSARQGRGLPTPSLGAICATCGGAGRFPYSQCGPINPNQRAIEAWAPKCPGCDGKGYTKKETT